MTDSQRQAAAFDELRGKTGAHSDLAALCDEAGLTVIAYVGDNRRSLVFLSGCYAPDGSIIQVGEIIGDSDAVIR